MTRPCNEREPESGVRRAYEMPVKRKRSRGRQKLRLRDVVQRDMKQKKSMMVHGRTEINGGRSAERPTRSRTGQGCTTKELLKGIHMDVI